MHDTLAELRSFQQFAEARLPSQDPRVTLEDLFFDWMEENDAKTVSEEDIAAVEAGIRLMEAGDRGITPEELDSIIARKMRVVPGE